MKKLILFFSFTLLTINISSQQWLQTSGPGGGNIKDVEFFAGHLFAACSPGGIFRSSDNGNTWIPINNFIPILFRNQTSITYSNGKLYSGTDNGIIKSSNLGAAWESVNNVNYHVKDMITLGNKVFAGTVQSGIYVSSDDGVTWVTANNGIVNMYILSLGKKESLLLAGSLGGGVFISNDTGKIWSTHNDGLTNLFINDIEAVGNDLFVATGAGVFKSTNNGSSWFSSGMGIIRPCILSLAEHNGILFAADSLNIYKSTNGGVLWNTINSWLPSEHITSTLNSANNFLFAGIVGYGLYKSSDNGINWQNSNEGLAATEVAAMIQCGRGILAGAYRRIYLSSDNGISWQASSQYLGCTKINSFTLNNGDIYAGTNGCGVYLSTDDGVTWSGVNNGLNNFVINYLSSNATRIFAGTENGVFYTTNRGQLWQSANNGLTSLYIRSIICVSNAIYLSSDNIYKSTNNGNTWLMSGNGLPQGEHVNEFYSVNTNLFAGTEHGVYVTSDNGTLWEPRISGIEILDVRAITGTGNYVIVSGYWSGRIFYSSNNGINWNLLNNGFPTFSIELFAYNEFIYSGSVDGGVFKFSKNAIGINKTNENIPSQYNLFQNYPNPFNPITNLKFWIPKPGFVSLVVYDITGKEIEVLVNEELKDGVYEVNWNAAKYSSGVYFYELKASEFKKTRKMILVK